MTDEKPEDKPSKNASNKPSFDIPGTTPPTGEPLLPNFVKKKTEVEPDKPRTFGGFVKNLERTQQKSAVARTGGLFAKTLNPALAGVEAMARYRAGDKRGALISSIQSVGGPIGFAAGVVNAMRQRGMGQQADASGSGGGTRKPPAVTSSGGEYDREGRKPTKGGETQDAGLGGASSVDALTGYQVSRDLANQLKKLRFPTVRGGRSINVTAGG